MPKKAQLLLVGFCPAFRLGGERGEADGNGSLIAWPPVGGLAGSRPASRRGACLVVRQKCGPECTWGPALSGAVAELSVEVAVGNAHFAVRTLSPH